MHVLIILLSITLFSMKNQLKTINLHDTKLIFPAVYQITCKIKIANLQAAKILKYMYQMVVNSV